LVWLVDEAPEPCVEPEVLPELDGEEPLMPLFVPEPVDDEPLAPLPDVPPAEFVPLEEVPLVPLDDIPPLVPPEDALPEDGEPDAHCCCACWVLGPMMPSIGPGSQPWSFSCCCSCRTEASPCCEPDWLPERAVEAFCESEVGPDAAAEFVPAELLPLEALFVPLEALLVPLEALLVPLEALFVPLEPLRLAVAPLVEPIDDEACEDGVEDCGWVAELSADCFEEELVFACAVTEKAAITAVAIASFFSSMVCSFFTWLGEVAGLVAAPSGAWTQRGAVPAPVLPLMQPTCPV
jgi:hypothetical protein